MDRCVQRWGWRLNSHGMASDDEADRWARARIARKHCRQVRLLTAQEHAAVVAASCSDFFSGGLSHSLPCAIPYGNEKRQCTREPVSHSACNLMPCQTQCPCPGHRRFTRTGAAGLAVRPLNGAIAVIACHRQSRSLCPCCFNNSSTTLLENTFVTVSCESFDHLAMVVAK
jgi:hypothetical protein